MPNWNHIVREHLAVLRLPPEREIEIVEEQALHLEAAYEDALADGSSEAEAVARALRSYDWRLLECELSRAERPPAARAWGPSLELIERIGGTRMGSFIQDLRFGARMLMKQPGVTLIAVLTLALGIGANTAIFSLVQALLLRELPFPTPDRIVLVMGANPKLGAAQSDADQLPTSQADLADWRRRQQAFELLAALQPQSVNFTDGRQPERVGGVGVSHEFFRVLGVGAGFGRVFRPEDEQTGATRSVILSHQLWQRRFGADPQALGRKVMLDSQEYEIVGVMPPGFVFPRATDLPTSQRYAARAELWLPLRVSPYEMPSRGNRFLTVLGRLKAGVTLAQAQAEMANVATSLAQSYPDTNNGYGVNVVPLQRQMTRNVQAPLWVLWGAVLFVLLIACANVANLLLAQAAGRRRETALRLALGAGRARIVRQLLTEGLLLAGLSGALGLWLAQVGTRLLLALAPDNLPQPVGSVMDARVFGFTASLALLTGVLSSMAPAWRLSQPKLNETLKDNSGAVASSGGRLRHGLVIAEVALTLALLVGAGLLIRSLTRLQQVETGLDVKNVLTMELNLPLQKYPNGQWSEFYRQLLTRVAALPGVQAAGLCFQLPLSGSDGTVGFQIPDRPQTDVEPYAGIQRVSPGYFRAMGVTVLRGRTFSEGDRETNAAPQPIVINEAMARRYWPGEDALGKRIDLFGAPCEIIGVVKDVRRVALEAEATPEFYLRSSLWFMNLVVRTDANPLGQAQAIQRQVQELDKDVPIAKVSTMEQVLAASTAPRRFNLFLLNLFACLALLLAMIGLYGVLSYNVTAGTREIGIRMALGAQPRNVVRLVIRQGMGLVLPGVGGGLAASFGLTRLMKAMLFGVSATDPLTFVGIALLLPVVALLACWFPARRATRVDPLTALRHE
jgi:putative ABC transport system permease protein